ncbi:MAG: tetratricopeptide repeat protein [Opitutaceae bacterium]|nr:tetratricopeptide repeat protein [Opitutaceae bacterium]
MSRSRTLAAGLILALAIVAAYAASLRGAFLWDDDLHITANPTIIGPLGLKEIWTTARANYFPLVLTNFWAQHALWGLDPLGYRLVTLACHVIAALLLWRVLFRLGVPGAWLGAALWALHPVQVESVAWICELKNTQSAVFFLAAILFWLRWLEVRRGSDSPLKAEGYSEGGSQTRPAIRVASAPYLLSLLCALLALLSKPSTVMLPVALALCAWWRSGRFTSRDLPPLAPFLALSVAVAGWTIWEQKFNSGAIGPEWSQTFPERIAIAGRAVWFYLGKLGWPEPLIFIYPRWMIDAGSATAFLGAAGIGATLALFAWRKWQGAMLAALYFGALLFPVLGFFNVYFFRYSFVGDHFQYLASMGPLALLAAAVARLPRRLRVGAGGALVVVLAVLTVRQTPVYATNEALWRHTLARNPAAFMAWANLGDTLRLAGRYDEAMVAYRSGLALRPDDAPVLNDLGNLLVLTGRPADAVPHFERALAARPGYAEAHCNLGNALRDLGRTDEAIGQFRRALELEPAYGGAHNNLGIQLAEAGRFAEAATHFEAALRASSGDAKIRDNLVRALHRQAVALIAAQQWPDAATLLRRASDHAPDSAAVRMALAVALAQAGQLDAAVPHFEAAVRLNPRDAEVRENFGRVLGALRRPREAYEQLEEAARLRREAPR